MFKRSAGLRGFGAGEGSSGITLSIGCGMRRFATIALLLVASLFASTAAAQSTTVSISGSRPATFARAGQVLTFYVRLETGNTEISSLTFTSGSPAGMSALSCPGVPAGIAVTTTCTFTYTVQSMDVAIGSISAVGRWRATRPTGAARSGSTAPYVVAYAPPRAPDAPVVGAVTAGDTEATVAFTPPDFDGGYPVDSYTVTSSPGGITAVGGGSPIRISGLTNGVAYRFSVAATNTIGTGDPSALSSVATPKASQTITFADPGAQNFGTTPTLVASASSNLAVSFASSTPAVCSTTTAGTLTFATVGTCTINVSQPGDAAYSPAAVVSRSFAVNAVAPGAPTIGSATAGEGSASVTFAAPTYTGGAAVTSYTVTSTPGGLTATGASSPVAINGLSNGTAYTFTVTATNSAGTGSASGASNAVTPRGSQSITFANPGAQAFGTSPTLVATSSAGLAVSFSSSTPGVCSITPGGTLTFVAAGTCTIDADQTGDASTLAASTVSRSFAVNAIAPGAPTVGVATAGDAQATVSFTAPVSNGGATIVGYTVTAMPGGLTATGATSPITVTGLTNGTAYTFTIAARNSAGTGAASAASNGVTPAGAQSITFANPGAQRYGTAPALVATSSSGLAVTFASSTPAVCTVTSGGVLAFIAAGTCTIDADQAGNAAYLPAARVTRSFNVDADVPGVPTGVTAVAGTAQATVSFVAPANTGGSAITGYTVTSAPGGVTASGNASPIVVPGLVNGTAYTFTVTAANSAGTSGASAPSSAVTPVPPLTVGAVSATIPYGAAATPVMLDVHGTATSVAVVGAPSHGTAVANGTSITYQPAAGYAGSDSFTYTATDGMTTTSAATVSITVSNPTIALDATAPAHGTGGSAYRHTFVASGGAAPYTFALAGGTLPDGLALSAGGELAGTPTQAGTFTFDVQATDASTGAGPFSAQRSYTLVVDAPQIAFTLGTLPTATYGTALAQTLQASGGTAPYTYTITAGTLPQGVTLSSAGALSGTPTEAGRFPITVEVRDANAFAASQNFELVVQQATQAITAFAANPAAPVYAPNGTFTVSAQGGASGNALVFATTTPTVCTVAGTTVTMRATGRCSLTADQAGDARFGAASQARLDIDIAAATPVLAWPTQLSKLLGEGAFDLPQPQSPSTGAITYASSRPEVATVSGRTVTLHGAGTTTITATQAANGNYAAGSAQLQLVVASRPDPTRDAAVTGLLQAQVDAGVRFAAAEQANIRDRLRQVRDGGNASSSNVTVAYAGRDPLQGASMPVRTAMPSMPTGWGVWLSGTATFGSAGRSDGFDVRTDGLTLGADRAIGESLLIGVAASVARNDSELDDDASRLDADQRAIALYGLWRASEHLFLDGVLGTGSLDFDLRRWSRDANTFGTATRDGDQWFASLSMGYEHRSAAMALTGYARVDATRTTLDAYRESGLGLYDLGYRRQVVDNSTVALGLEGRWIVGDAGRVRPFWSVEYREAIENRGEAAMNYVVGPNASDYRLRMASYNDNALSLNAGFDMTLGRRWLLSLLLGHEQSRNSSDANSIGVRLTYGGQGGTAPAALNTADAGRTGCGTTDCDVSGR